MAVKTQGPLANKQTIRTLEGGAQIVHHPFKVYVVGVNDAEEKALVKVSRYSRVLNEPNVSTKTGAIRLVGTDLQLDLKYGTYIYLDIYYDANMEPIIGIIEQSPTLVGAWYSTTDELEVVTGLELEFITNTPGHIIFMENNYDISSDRIDGYKTKAINEIEFRHNTGQMDEAQYNASIAGANTGYAEVKSLLAKARSNLNQFFAGSPHASWKKLFRTHTLIAYTTKNLSPLLGGTVIEIHKPAAASSSTPVANNDSKFQLVQCLNTDLLLTEICYQNRYPARLPMAFSRPVYLNYVGADVEDTILNP